MNLIIRPNIFVSFPGVAVGVVIIRGMDNSKVSDDILSLLRCEEIRQKKLLENTEIGKLPEIAAWREIYAKFGSNRDFRSSIESLLRRARGGSKPLPQINNLVDLYNYLSLKYHLPVGAEDTDKIKGDLVLDFADGTEKGITLGSESEESCYPGEVIYKDDAGFVCRRWNWREADRTKIEKTTKNAVMVFEKVPQVDGDTFNQALNEATEHISKYLSGKSDIVILDKNKPESEI
jgi:DNA/RNA-binding domain of Phe-tRNA-synthetase-like protein